MAKHRIENVTKKTDIRIKKKKWISIIAPKDFNEVEIGETLCERPEQAVGRTVVANLSSLINDPKKQHVQVRLRVKSVQNDKAFTEIAGYELSGAYVKKVIRRIGGKMEDSFLASTKDNVKFRIKPLLMTRHKIYKSTLNDIRIRTREHIISEFKNMDMHAALAAVIQNKLQKDIRDNVKKIYPVSLSEIRKLELQ